MKQTVEMLRRRVRTSELDFADGEVYQLLEAGLCLLCCRDGARGGNKSCAPNAEIQQDT